MTCTSSSSSNLSFVSLLTISSSHSTLLSSSFIAILNHPIGSIDSKPELLHQIIQLDQSTSNPNSPSPKFEIYPNPQRTESSHSIAQIQNLPKPPKCKNQFPSVLLSLSVNLSFFLLHDFLCVFFLPFTSRNHKKQLEIFKIFKGFFLIFRFPLFG